MSIFDYKPASSLKTALTKFMARSTARGALATADLNKEKNLVEPRPSNRLRRSSVAHHLRSFPNLKSCESEIVVAADGTETLIRYENGQRIRPNRFTWTHKPKFHKRPPYARIIQYDVTSRLVEDDHGKLKRKYRHQYLHATKGWRSYSLIPLGIAGA